jgi:hypothetical protein
MYIETTHLYHYKNNLNSPLRLGTKLLTTNISKYYY